MSRGLLAAGAAMLLVVAACSSAKVTPDPMVAYCDSLQTLATSVKTLQDANAQSTVEDVQTDAAAVKDAAAAVVTAAENLAEDQAAAIQSAADQLKDAVGNVDTSDTVAAALQSLMPQVDTLRESINAAGEKDCGKVYLEAKASAAASAAVDAAASAAAAAASAKAAVESKLPEPSASPAG